MKSSVILRPTLAMSFSVLATAWGCAGKENTDPNTGGASGTATTGGATTGGVGGTVSTGGATTGGATTGGATTGGATTGGATTGGVSGMGGTAPVGGTAGSGGTDTVGGAAGSGGASGSAGSAAGGTAGQSGGAGGKAGSGGSGGSVVNAMGPCDIYAAASPATPCVAAYSTVRSLRSTYTGPLYQLRKGGPDPNTGSGGTTQDIGTVGGFADVAAHEAFCGTTGTCTFSILYDQSGRMNNLTVAKGGCYEGTAAEDDYESDAKRRKFTVGGHSVYALYMDKHEGYRNTGTKYPTVGPAGAGMPTGSQEQGIYAVEEGSARRQGAGCCCCFNFGNGSRNNCYGPTGQMNALFFGTGYWGKGAGNGPWFMGDFEAGVWAGGSGASNAVNNNLPSMTMNYAFGILKSRAGNYAIRTADATTGNITTAYDGNAPANWTMEGAIILGIGGDNSNSSDGTFLEGAITAGRPSDATDALVHENVKAVRYGM